MKTMHPTLFSERPAVDIFRDLIILSLILIFSVAVPAQIVLKVETAKPVSDISPLLYGLMTEEINHSYDGGLYAELIQNRIFKDSDKDPAHWSIVQETGGTSAIALDTSQPIEETVLKTALKLSATNAAPGHPVGIANDGYWGITVKPNTTYRASFYARTESPAKLPLMVSIQSNDGKTIFASAKISNVGGSWQKYTVALKTKGNITASAANKFVISTETPGNFWFNLVSLFPPTYKNRPNGNRVDLMQMLVDLKPKFLRLPGGNYLEGETIDTRLKWKETLGALENRPGNPGTWRYRASDGMGLLEFMEWCEDMNAEPILAVFAGYALKREYIAVGPQLQPFVEEALDEIEYVTGDVHTKWGAQRAKDGHPKPFPLRYVEIGNEDGFDVAKSYDGRFTQFYDAIKAKYPQLKIISTVNGKDPLGQRQLVTSRTPDVVDEHYYLNALEMMNNSLRYDSYARTGPKTFIGEWATREGSPTTNLIAGLGDAAFMTGMERNADIIRMACYAPLFVNVNPGGMQWKSDLIGFDAQTSYGSPSYYAQKMFSENLGTQSLAVSADAMTTQTWQPATPKDRPQPPARQIPTVYFSATRDDKKIYLKVVNTIASAQQIKIQLSGATKIKPDGTAVVLTSAQPTDTNTISDPIKVVPKTTKASGLAPEFTYNFLPYSVTVLVISTK